MKEVEKAYIAGLLDGEGTICVSNQLALFAKICNTDRDVIMWIAGLTGGRVYDNEHLKTRKNKIQYSLEYSGFRAHELIKIVYPYLRIKRPQAELALKFPARRKGEPYRNSAEDINLKRALRQGISSENHRVQETTIRW